MLLLHTGSITYRVCRVEYDRDFHTGRTVKAHIPVHTKLTTTHYDIQPCPIESKHPEKLKC